MSTPPTLNYAPPPPPPPGATAVFVLLLLLGTLYACIVALFFLDFAVFRSGLSPIGYVFYSFAAIFSGIFITAAIRIRHRSYPWAVAAFATTLINIAVILSVLGYAAFNTSSGEELMLGCCISSLSLAFLIPLPPCLVHLMRHLKQSP